MGNAPNYAEYAEIMPKLCRNHAGYAEIMPKSHHAQN